MSISPNVVIMTRAELSELENRWFQKGVARGRFEQRHNDSKPNTPETGQHRLARQAAPIGTLSGVGPQAAGHFSPEGWTFEDNGNGVVYVRAPSGKHAAIGYMAPGDMVLSGILHELVATILSANAAAT